MAGDEHPSDRPPVAGLNPADLLALPDAERQLLTWLLRRAPARLDEIAAQLGQSEADAQTCLEDLIARSLVQRGDDPAGPRYRAALAPKRSSRLSGDLWKTLDKKLTE